MISRISRLILNDDGDVLNLHLKPDKRIPRIDRSYESVGKHECCGGDMNAGKTNDRSLSIYCTQCFLRVSVAYEYLEGNTWKDVKEWLESQQYSYGKAMAGGTTD